MIVELFKYLSNPASASAKKLGQLQETIAMEARYNRSKKQWESHLNHSKSVIKSSAEKINENKDIIILGSGLLLDTPIEYLAKKFNAVYLIDVVHLKKTKKIMEKYSNVHFVDHDITGLSQGMLDAKKGDSLMSSPSIPYLSANTGLVVSANMLSQLHLAPICYAEKELDFDDEKLEQLACGIVSSHIILLKNLNCPVCLLTDYSRIYKDKTGGIVETETVLFDVKLPQPDTKWYWEIAPIGELDKNTSMSSLVYAYENFGLTDAISDQKVNPQETHHQNIHRKKAMSHEVITS